MRFFKINSLHGFLTFFSFYFQFSINFLLLKGHKIHNTKDLEFREVFVNVHQM